MTHLRDWLSWVAWKLGTRLLDLSDWLEPTPVATQNQEGDSGS